MDSKIVRPMLKIIVMKHILPYSNSFVHDDKLVAHKCDDALFTILTLPLTWPMSLKLNTFTDISLQLDDLSCSGFIEPFITLRAINQVWGLKVSHMHPRIGSKLKTLLDWQRLMHCSSVLFIWIRIQNRRPK